MKKNNGIKKDTNIEFTKEFVISKEKIFIWLNTTNIIVNPRKASMYSTRFVGCLRSVVIKKIIFSLLIFQPTKV
ncbi:MAG: hypothetical protein UHM19_04840 [Bacteroidales bacterium]|nr:hypothetical protein [Bacteroidales bacterium]